MKRASLLPRASVVVICNNHPDLARSAPRFMVSAMREGGFIYDYWNNFSNLQPAETEGIYFAVGNRQAVGR